MKNSLKSILFGAVAVCFAFTLTACSPTDSPKNGTNSAEQQVARAQSTYNSFYNKNGGLFSTSQQPKARAVVAASNENLSFDAVREVLQKGYMNSSNFIKNTFNSYVADIFAYSQVQTSIMDEFGTSALTNVYTLNYDEVDWTSDTTTYGNWIKQTKLLSASFAGTDLSNGNVYCTQSHRPANNALAIANLEYYYNSDGDMGVTTLNWHDSKTFEYHYCSAGTYEILFVGGTYNDDGEISLNSFEYWSKSGVVDSVSDKQVIYSYVQSEISRINGKIDELQKGNERERTLDGTEEDVQEEEDHIGVCSVKLDFSILQKMLIK